MHQVTLPPILSNRFIELDIEEQYVQLDRLACENTCAAETVSIVPNTLLDISTVGIESGSKENLENVFGKNASSVEIANLLPQDLGSISESI